MNKYSVTFIDRDGDLCQEFICESISPIYALVKAEEFLKLWNWLDDKERKIEIKLIDE